jgi:hypothetical protein
MMNHKLMTKKLKNLIQKKLDTLQDLLDQILEAQTINSDDPDTWDSDTLYNLVENLKEALGLLEDQKIPGKDEFGEPLYEEGLCSLIDLYQNPEDYEDYEM